MRKIIIGLFVLLILISGYFLFFQREEVVNINSEKKETCLNGYSNEWNTGLFVSKNEGVLLHSPNRQMKTILSWIVFNDSIKETNISSEKINKLLSRISKYKDDEHNFIYAVSDDVININESFFDAAIYKYTNGNCYKKKNSDVNTYISDLKKRHIDFFKQKVDTIMLK